MTTAAATPVIKWVGGKTRLLPELVRRMPKAYDRYFEPFAGGAALFFHVAPERAVLADQNRDLITLYQALADDPARVIRRLRDHRQKHGKRYYYRVRDRWNDRERAWTPAARAAAFVYLNKTCFNGLWRVNRSGEFNVPMGRYKEPAICRSRDLCMAGIALSRARLLSCDYSLAVVDAGRGDFVYFDPPYDPVSATSSFTGYSAGGFSRDDQRSLAALAHTLVERGCHVMLSNNDTRFVRSLYKGFRIERVLCSRAVNSDATKRGAIAELVITGGPRAPDKHG